MPGVATDTNPFVDLRIPLRVWIVKAPLLPIEVVAVPPNEAVYAERFVVEAFVVKSPPLKLINVPVAFDGKRYPIEFVITPVDELYVMPAPPESDVEPKRPRVEVDISAYEPFACPKSNCPNEGATASPVPPYVTPMEVVAETMPPIACNGPLREPSVSAFVLNPPVTVWSAV